MEEQPFNKLRVVDSKPIIRYLKGEDDQILEMNIETLLRLSENYESIRIELVNESTPVKLTKEEIDKKLNDYKEKYGCLRLELGSGLRPLKDYLHIDLMVDVEKPYVDFIYDIREMPFDDETFDEIVGIHILEHIYWMAVPWVVSECNRILKPGGKLILEIPDLDVAIKRDKLRETDLFFDTIYMNCWGDSDSGTKKDFITGFNHTSCWNEEMLTAVMKSCGFSVIRDKERENKSVHNWIGVLTLVGTKTDIPLSFDEFNRNIKILDYKYLYSKKYKTRYG